MKAILASFVLAGLAATSAEAGCSKSSLNGFWSMEAGSIAFPTPINNGVFYFSGDKFTISSLSGSTCRGNGSYLDTSGPTTYDAKFAVEASARDAGGKPQRLIAAYTTDGGLNYTVFVLTRR